MPSRVNTGVMYDNLMNKFEYDVKASGFFMNSDNLRMLISMRNTYARLAGALADEGDLERAVLVADRSLELMPDEVQAYDYFNMPLAIVYYKSGMTEKGDQIIHRLWEIQDEQLGWYFSFRKDQIPSLIDDIQDNFAMLNAMRQVVVEFKRDELLQQIEQGVETYYSLYTARQL